nr:head GIN domain-containing protein [Robiginitalea sp. SC105]
MLTACNLSGQWGKRVKGNGNTVTETREVGSYEGVSLSGWFDVELVPGPEGQITISGEENLLEHLVTEVNREGSLVIRTEKGYNLQPSSWKGGGIQVTVPVESIREVTLSGSGDIVGKTRLKADRFETGMSGSGDITLELDADHVEASLSGSGDIVLSGTAGSVEIRVSGSGDVKAFDLSAREVEAVVSGSADVRVTATESLTARVSGSGDIHYRGNPASVDSKTSGSGDVVKD